MDAQRALLDSLMGLNRDGDRPNEAILDFSHPKVCKLYLCGLCPRELFQHTRLDAGACDLLHVPALRSAFEQEQDVVPRDFEYERQLATELSKLLVDVEKKISRAQKRLEEDGDETQDRTQILQLTQDIQDATSKAEQAAREQDADTSMQLVEHVEVLKKKRRELLRPSTATSNVTGVAMMVDNVNQKLRVCDVCGAFLSIFDSDRRLADHFGGKVHVGYVQIRKKLKELMEKIQADTKRKADRKEDKLIRRRSPDRSRREEYARRRRESEAQRRCVEDRERRRNRDRSRSQEHRRRRDRSNGRSHRSRRRSKSCSRSPAGKRSRSRRHRH